MKIKLELPVKDIYVNQPFGVNFVDFYKKLDLDGHNGIDFKAKTGAKVFAAHNGKITKAKDSEGFYKYIELQGKGFRTRYGHLSELMLGQGTDVRVGQVIALSGNSGKYTTGPHLHFDLKETVNGRSINYSNGYKGAIDPAPYFKKNWDKSHAYHRYGRKGSYWAEFKVRFKNPWLHRQLKKRNKIHLVYDNEFINALVYGGWDFESVINPGMYDIWAWAKKDEWEKGKINFK